MRNLLNRIGEYLGNHLVAIILLVVLAASTAFLVFGTRSDDGSITLDGSNAKYSQGQEDALCELSKSRDAAVANVLGVDVPQDASSGCEPTDLPQMGSMPYYKVDVSTPAAFVNAVNGRGFNEGYGYQCVAGFKEFMFSLSGKYVAAAGGGAKGYATQQSQIEALGFKWHSGTAGLQDGDWGIFTQGTYGHVAMYYQGKWFGQNQGAANANVGNAFNLSSLGISPAGYYRPNIYQKSTPAPTPKPEPSKPSTGGNTGSGTQQSTSYNVQRGDTLGGIALKNGWYGSANGLYGDAGYAQRLAELNGISNRGLIYPNQVIKRVE